MYTNEEMKDLIDEVYADLFETTDSYLSQAEAVTMYDYQLKKDINIALSNGEIEGKNVAERDAATQKLFGNRLGTLQDMKNKESSYRTDLDLARIKVERIRALLRLMELSNESN